ncbi:hypothetical protein G3I40_13545, partial [Streptomyces sp. SID14478]|uniref:hypothetical protein n=1 Tax=Streptomyces sp. SID14478 TaxID=2706073 RepID=UPI0013DB19B5
MRTSSLLARSALTVAAAAALSSAPAATAFAAGINVTSSGSTVTATTTSCPNDGNASLLASGQADFAQGRQTPLTGGTASWTGVGSGSYQVVAACADGSTVGPASVTVTSSPTISATSSPIGGVRGGLGGAAEDFGTLTLAAGGTLVAAAALGTA